MPIPGRAPIVSAIVCVGLASHVMDNDDVRLPPAPISTRPPSSTPSPTHPPTRQALGQCSRRHRAITLVWVSIALLLATAWLVSDRAGHGSASADTGAAAPADPWGSPPASPDSAAPVAPQALAAVQGKGHSGAVGSTTTSPASPLSILSVPSQGAQPPKAVAPVVAPPVNGASTVSTAASLPFNGPAAPSSSGKCTCFVKNSVEFRLGITDDRCDFIQLAPASEDDEVSTTRLFGVPVHRGMEAQNIDNFKKHTYHVS